MHVNAQKYDIYTQFVLYRKIIISDKNSDIYTDFIATNRYKIKNEV
jgi:hypothetical protein